MAPTSSLVGAPVTNVKRSITPRTKTMLAAATIAVVLMTIMFSLPVPYILETPGPAVDTLGWENGIELVQVEGQTDHSGNGQLLLTTVSAIGSTEGSLSLPQLIAGYFNSANSLLPRDLAFPRGQTSEERDQALTDQMIDSQQNSTVAALEFLGYTVTPVVELVQNDGPSAGLLESEDRLEFVNSQPVTGYSHLLQLLDQLEPGQTVTIGYERAGQPGAVDVVTADVDGHARLGLGLSLDPPITVTFGLEGIGGPSAGMMFALAIIEKLGEQDLTGGQVIAGTGTISANGEIGQIGGVRQKMIGATRNGATVFLVPASNCSDVIGNQPANLQVVKVSTLSDAVNSLTGLASGQDQALPSCTE